MKLALVEYYPAGKSRLLYILNKKMWRRTAPVYYRRWLPQNWNELTDKQLLQIIRSRFFLKSDLSQKVYLLYKFLNIPVWVVDDFTKEQVEKFHNYISFLFGDVWLTKTLIKKVRVFHKVFYGPESYASTMTWLEYIDADTAYCKWIESQKDADLNNMVAILYRERDKKVKRTDIDFNGDLRVKYNDWNYDTRLLWIKMIPKAKRLAIAYQYMGIRNYLEKKFPLTYSYKSDGRSFGKAGLILTVAGGKFGNEQQAQYANLIAVLTEFEMFHNQNVA